MSVIRTQHNFVPALPLHREEVHALIAVPGRPDRTGGFEAEGRDQGCRAPRSTPFATRVDCRLPGSPARACWTVPMLSNQCCSYRVDWRSCTSSQRHFPMAASSGVPAFRSPGADPARVSGCQLVCLVCALSSDPPMPTHHHRPIRPPWRRSRPGAVCTHSTFMSSRPGQKRLSPPPPAREPKTCGCCRSRTRAWSSLCRAPVR